MNIQRGDIVLVDFPYSDKTGHKVRPALVVQSDVWNYKLDDTIIALITSSRHRRIGAATQHFIDISISTRYFVGWVRFFCAAKKRNPTGT